jgi:hypothetical protein
MKIRCCLSSCLFAMGFLAVPLSPAQEAAIPVPAGGAPAPAATAGASVNEAGQNESPSTQTNAEQQHQYADAERIALLEARVATLERELQQLRSAMRSAGAALSGAAAGGDVGDAALTRRGPVAPRIPHASAGVASGPSASKPYRVPPPTEEDRQKYMSLSEAGRLRYMNEMRGRTDEISKATQDQRAAIFKEALERALQMDATNAGRATGSPAPNANANPNTNTAAPVPPAAADTPQGERTGFTSLPPTARARFVEELRERQNEFANASTEDRQAMVKEAMERAQRAAAEEARTLANNASSNGSSNSNIGPPTMPMPTPAPATAPENAGRAPLPSLPTPTLPMVARDANAVPEAPTPAPAPAPSTVTSTDASRLRFEALSEEQRQRFIGEMRKNREKLANATPAEREIIMNEALTKVEKEAVDATAAEPAAGAKTESQPQPQNKAKPADGKKN